MVDIQKAAGDILEYHKVSSCISWCMVSTLAVLILSHPEEEEKFHYVALYRTFSVHNLA